jgi:hypothetical protein
LINCYRQAALFSAVMLVFLMSPRLCSADTYQIVSLGTDANVFLYGIDDAGTVVLNTSGYCDSTCYATYVNGSFAGSSSAAPDLDFDNGTACSPGTPSGFVLAAAVCNDGREAFTGQPSLDVPVSGIYSGQDLGADLIAWGGGGPLMLNANGDILWDDRFSEEIYEAIDLTPVQLEALEIATPQVPEPASVLLLGTAALLIFAMTRGAAIRNSLRKRSLRG